MYLGVRAPAVNGKGWWWDNAARWSTLAVGITLEHLGTPGQCPFAAHHQRIVLWALQLP